MTTTQWVVLGVVFAWGAWALGLIVKRSFTEDYDIFELIGLIALALVIIVIIWLLAMWIT